MSSQRTNGPGPELRIADADRDAAVAALGEHFAAGRLTREELDERSDRALAARTPSALAPLFADLPAPWPPAAGKAPGSGPRSQQAAGGPWRGHGSRWRGRGGVVLPIPLVVLVVLAAVVVLEAPWLLFVAFGVLWCTGWAHRRS